MAGCKHVAIVVLLGSVLSLTVVPAATTAATRDSLSDKNRNRHSTAIASRARRRWETVLGRFAHTHGIRTGFEPEPPVQKDDGNGRYVNQIYYWPAVRKVQRDSGPVAYTTTTRRPSWREIVNRARSNASRNYSRVVNNNDDDSKTGRNPDWHYFDDGDIPVPVQRNRKIIDLLK